MIRKSAQFTVLASLAGAATFAHAAPITAGDLVVYRVGDGTTTYGGSGGTAGSVAGAAFLDEYTPTGTLVQTIALPTAVSGSNHQVVNSVTATSEGMITLSGNGQYIVGGGYGANVGTTGIASTASSSTPRVIFRTDMNGNTDSSTALSDSSYTGNNIRGVSSVDGTSFYATGTATAPNGGVRYVSALGNSTSTQVNTTANVRTTNIFGGRLYFTTGSGTTGVKTLTDPLPTAATGETESNLTSDASPYQFVILDNNGDKSLDAGDTLYVADDATGILKATYNGTAFGTTSTLAALTNVRGLTGSIVNGNAVLYATTYVNSIKTDGTSSSFSTSLVSLTDTGSGTPAPTTLATFSGSGTSALAVEGFRGVVLAVPEPASLSLLGLGGLTLLRRRRV